MGVESGACRICGSHEIHEIFRGPIRHGKFGNLTEDAMPVVRCGECRTGRLLGEMAVDYRADEYRILVEGEATAALYRQLHDDEQPLRVGRIGVHRLRNAVVADVGCGAGSFLDLVRGVAARTIAIEPAEAYWSDLRKEGHEVFPYCVEAAGQWEGRVDVAVCFSVVEHVDDPKTFLEEIRTLLRPGGLLFLSTPNLLDWLLEMRPHEYGSFFFRTVHPWYFDAESLGHLARLSGFSACNVEFFHRFDLSNILLWLRDGRPTGRAKLSLPRSLDAGFCAWLEAEGRSDYLFATLCH